MDDFLTAIGLAFVLEGALYALFPNLARRMMAYALSSPDGKLRQIGLMTAVVGVTIVGLIRGFA